MFHTSGDWDVLPTLQLQLRLRAPWPTNWAISIGGTQLVQVSDLADHPEHYLTGYFNVGNPTTVDISDGNFFWPIYVRLPTPLQFSAAPFQIAVTNISQNASLPPAAPLLIGIRGWSAISPSGFGETQPSSIFFDGHDNSLNTDSQIVCCVTIAGWLESGQPNHNAPGTYGGTSHPDYTEDTHYDMLLDNDFIRRNYVNTSDSPLGSNATIPGRCYGLFCGNHPLPLLYGPPNADTFLMPGEGDMTVELNAWHLPDRGAPPPGWLTPDPSFPTFTKDAWPFSVLAPFGVRSGDPPLAANDYVIVSGYLIEDQAHVSGARPAQTDPAFLSWTTRKCWDHIFSGQGGWLEIHPVDAVRAVRALPGQVGPPLVRKNAVVVQACSNFSDNTGLSRFDQKLTPWPTASPSPGSTPQAFNIAYEEDVDPRFTDLSTVMQHTIQACNGPNGPVVHEVVQVKDQGHFKSTVLVWWEIAEGSAASPLPAC